MPIVTNIDKVDKVLRGLDTLRETKVLVGVPENKSPRNSDGDITNAELAYIHDNGAPEAGIPARPFMAPGIKASEEKWEGYLKAAGQAALDGKENAVEKNLQAAGITAATAIKSKINAGVPPPLSKRTLAARKRAGYQGTKPLIRTGQLRNAITYVLRKLKG